MERIKEASRWQLGEWVGWGVPLIHDLLIRQGPAYPHVKDSHTMDAMEPGQE